MKDAQSIIKDLSRTNDILKLELCRISAMNAYLKSFHESFHKHGVSEGAVPVANLELAWISSDRKFGRKKKR